MAGKQNTQVIIDGRILNLAGYEDEEYLQRIAAYINHKIKAIDAELKGRFVNADLRAALIEINIADELMKLQETTDLLEADLTKRSEELKLAKQELASLQVELEQLKKEK